GEVHVVQELDLGRTVALKRLLPRSCRDEDLARFYREAQITAQLEHPSIVPVYRLEQPGDGELAYTMKLIDGVTLAEYIEAASEQLRASQVLTSSHDRPARLRHFIKIAEAISYAHSRGYIHRDLKPSNVMIGPFGEVYVMDWGLARLSDTDDTIVPEAGPQPGEELSAIVTMAGAVLGTPAYMAPEQARGEQPLIGPASDQYTLGLILQELVTLEKAIPAPGATEALQQAMVGYRKQPAAPTGEPPIARELRAIMSRALSLEPEGRYPDVSALIEDLQRYLDGKEVLASPDSSSQRMARWLSHHRGTTLLIIVGLLLVVFMSSTTFLYRQDQLRDAAAAREAVLTRLLTATASQSQQIDRQILRYEGLTMSLAAVATQALTHGGVDPDPAYTDHDFADPAAAPPDLGWSPRYQRLISIDWPVFKLAPGVTRESVQPLLDRLSSVRHTFRLAMLRSKGEAAVTLPEEQIHMLLVEWGVPLVWAYVGFEEGVHMSYPGKGGYPDDYDPRQRPWYLRTLGTSGPHWGEPYLDALGQGLLLPCTMSIYDERHTFRGVAGVEMTLDTVVAELLELPGIEGIEETLLLDPQGRVLVRSADTQPRLDSEGELSLPMFSSPETRQAIRGRGTGYFQDDDEVILYNRLGSLGWFYVVRGPADVLLGAH
ncbi:MAG: serine/threonine protein kinase, partial [Myxococcota bacterium]